MTTSICWFRNDLRLHDHEPLLNAIKDAKSVLPVYVFDPLIYGKTRYGFPKTGAFRAKFISEAVAELRESLRKIGSDLIVRIGKPSEVLAELAQKTNASRLTYSEEVTSEEIITERSVDAAMGHHGVKVLKFWTSTLYHRDDIPFLTAQDIPDVYTQFRKGVEKKALIQQPLRKPSSLPPLPENVEAGEIPPLSHWGLKVPEEEPRAAIQPVGGELAGLGRLHDYFWKRDQLKVYKETRNGLLGEDYSSKFSPWLAAGCLSPRLIRAEIQRYEGERTKNKSTYWLVFELIWRDFFRFEALKTGNRLFWKSGPRGVPVKLADYFPAFEKWANAETGIPFVDANMIELARTGFMSNRGRQNVASYLVKDLHVNWQIGAEWFESLLVDYDVCSNWGNWAYVAGVGNDPREDRYFAVIKQGKRYDEKGNYVRHWLPELADVPDEFVHEPWKWKRAS